MKINSVELQIGPIKRRICHNKRSKLVKITYFESVLTKLVQITGSPNSETRRLPLQ